MGIKSLKIEQLTLIVLDILFGVAIRMDSLSNEGRSKKTATFQVVDEAHSAPSRSEYRAPGSRSERRKLTNPPPPAAHWLGRTREGRFSLSSRDLVDATVRMHMHVLLLGECHRPWAERSQGRHIGNMEIRYIH